MKSMENKTMEWSDPFVGPITLDLKGSNEMNCMGETRVTEVYSHVKLKGLWIFSYLVGGEMPEPIFLNVTTAEIVWEAMGGRRWHVRQCFCDPATYPELSQSKWALALDFCWKCDAFRKRE